MAEIKKPKKPSWHVLAMSVVMGVAGGGLGYLLAKAGMEFMPASLSLKVLTAWDLLWLPVIIVFVLAFHEAGHLAGGMSRGMRFLLFIAGPFGWIRGKDGVQFRWFFNLGTLGGVASAMPVPGQPLKPQLTRLVVGGPLASLVLAVLAFAVFWWVPGRVGGLALVTAGLSLSIFVVTAVPMRSGGFMSDGMQLLQLWRNPPMVERRARLIALMGQGMSGLRPREYDRGSLASAQAITGDEAIYDVGVWLYSYFNALDAGEARGWLARARGGVVDVSRRRLAEAAVAAREGRREEALSALATAEARFGASMDAGVTLLSADQVAGLRAELAAA